jgi:hypothetical protein
MKYSKNFILSVSMMQFCWLLSCHSPTESSANKNRICFTVDGFVVTIHNFWKDGSSYAQDVYNRVSFSQTIKKNNETHALQWSNIEGEYGQNTLRSFNVTIDGKAYSYPKDMCGAQNKITFTLNGKSHQYLECAAEKPFPYGQYTSSFDYTPEQYNIWGSESVTDGRNSKNTINICFINIQNGASWQLWISYWDQNGHNIIFSSAVDISLLKNRDQVGAQVSASLPGPFVSDDKSNTLSGLSFAVETIEPSQGNGTKFLTHNTGNLEVSIFENGNIGHLYTGDIGRGVRFMMGNDVLYSSGLIFGTKSGRYVNGHIGSAGISADFINTVPMTGFTSNSSWDQIAEATFNDSRAPVPFGLTVNQISYSNTGDYSMMLKYRLYGSYSIISDLYVGIFADWDIGGTEGANLNLGGYDPSRNMAYQYLGQGKDDINYYGIIALCGMSGARVTATNPSGAARDSSFTWISTFRNESITVPADYRMWIGSGPTTLSATDTLQMYFAIVAGISLQNLKLNADAAIAEYNSINQ